MTLWAISAAPLYLGNDLTNLDAYGLSLLTNPEVIAVDQAGTPARPVSSTAQQQIWYALNTDGSYTVALFNLGRTDKDITANFSDLGLTGAATVRDLWARKDLGRFPTTFTASTVPIHGVRLLKVTPQPGAAVAVNDDALRVAYQGDWTRNGGNEVAATAPDQGLVDISIDGKFAKRVNNHSAARSTQQKVFSASGLRNGQHTGPPDVRRSPAWVAHLTEPARTPCTK